MTAEHLPSPKIAIVTGASSGIGRESALQLMAAGFIVHAVARRMEAMADLAQKGARLHKVDLTNAAAISRLVKDVLAQDGRVDALVNNAGYGFYGAVEEVPMEEARRQIEVNLFAPAALIKEVLPTMRSQRFGRIINISSIGGKVWSPMGAWYHASKYGLEGLSDSLRNEVRPFGINVVIIQPGGIKTEWAHIAMDNMKKTSKDGPYAPIAMNFANMLEQAEENGRDEKIMGKPGDIARLVVEAATTSRPHTRYVAPFSAKVSLFLRWLLNDRLYDKLWNRVFGIPQSL